ncbi:ABC transporter six-transmembrane domain-containing protein [Cognatishimia maritima]|uniref:ABC transporter transmembrane region n=1 Tax=Cognatishimia maritima TaxID=870908 RepID=A0A1M5U9Q4_9RHOB|nr:ABC transporter six-transmembrane domain-containing protein [Cognatishimia maritima]SHH59785.1 ABC transporter transmembrane region [Cognatishimia maritima]
MDDQEPSGLDHLRANRLRIGFSFFLSFLETGISLCYPWATGYAVNGLKQDNYLSLGLLIVTWLAHIAISSGKQAFDTRMYSKLNATISYEVVDYEKDSGTGVSMISARVEMIEELVDFFEQYFPMHIATIVGILGSLVFLFFYDVVSGMLVLLLLLPIAGWNVYMGLRAFRTNKRLNTEWEKQVRVVAGRRKNKWKVHFLRMAKWRIRLSDMNLAGWLPAQFLLLGAAVFVLIRFSTNDAFLAGDILAVVAYIYVIERAVDELPDIAQQIGRLIDIARRLGQV